MNTYEELIAKSKALAASGDLDKAKRVAEIALQRRGAVEEKGFKQKAKEFLFGDNDPNSQNLGEKIGSTLNKAGEALTYGLIGDEASAAVESIIPGVDYEDRRDHYRKQEGVLERDSPGVALAADIGGSVAGAALPIGLAARTGSGIKNFAKAVGLSSAAGGSGSAIYGFNEGEGELSDRLQEGKKAGIVGAGLGAAVPVAGAGIGKLANTIAQNKAIKGIAREAPTTEQARAEGRAAYNAIERAGVQFKPEAFSSMRQGMVQALRDRGLDELPGPSSLTPKSARVMEIAKQMDSQMSDAASDVPALPFSSLDQLRRHAGTAARGVDKTDSSLGMEAISQIDDFVKNISPSDIQTGDVAALQEMLPRARDAWVRMSKSQLIDDAISAEGNYLSGGSSAIRNKFAQILRNEKISKGFSEADKRVMQKVVRGSIPEQLLNYMGSGLGVMGQMGLGVATGNPIIALGAIAAAAGSRKASETITKKKAELARALIASGRSGEVKNASPAIRNLTEQLLRQGTAAVQQ